MRIGNVWCTLVIAGALLLSACSPESGRTRSGGPGADIGNRAATLDMHGNSDPGFQVPERGKAIQIERSTRK